MAQVPASAAEADRATNQPQSDPLPGGISEEDAEVAVSVLGVMGRLDLHSFRGPSLKRLRNALEPCAALLSDPSPWLNSSFLALLWSGEMDVRGEVLRFLPLEDIGRVIPRLSKIFRDEQPVVLYRVARAVSPGVCEEALREFIGSTDKSLEEVFPDGPQEGKMKDAFDEVRGVGERIEEPILHEAIGRFLDVVHFEGRDFRVFCGDDLEAWGDEEREEITMIDDEEAKWIRLVTSPDLAENIARHGLDIDTNGVRMGKGFSEGNLCVRNVEFTIKFQDLMGDENPGDILAAITILGCGSLHVESILSPESDFEDEFAGNTSWNLVFQPCTGGSYVVADPVMPDTCYKVSIVIDWNRDSQLKVTESFGTQRVAISITDPYGWEDRGSYEYACEPMTHIGIWNTAAAVTLISSFRMKYSERIERDTEFRVDN